MRGQVALSGGLGADAPSRGIVPIADFVADGGLDGNRRDAQVTKRTTIAYLGFVLIVACQSDQERACQHLAEKYHEWASEAFGYDPALFEIEVFYSDTVDACLHADFAHVGVRAQIRDLSKTILVDHPQPYPVLMFCDDEWAYRTELDEVRKRRGKIAHVDYDEWQERWEPDEVHTREDCMRIYSQALEAYRN